MSIDTNNFRKYTWKHPYVIHWMLNPGLAVNELLLGQKVPKEMYAEKQNRLSIPQNGYIHCPHCSAMHSSMKWSGQNKTAMGNWFGLYCDQCGKIIPCVWNFTSLLILALTFPIWGWFRKSLQQRWLRVQEQKFAKPLKLQPPVINYYTLGVSFGIYLYLFNYLIIPFLLNEPLPPNKLIGGIFASLLGGFLFSFLFAQMMGRPKQKPVQQPDQTA